MLIQDMEECWRPRVGCAVESIAGTSFDAAEAGPQAHNFMNHSL